MKKNVHQFIWVVVLASMICFPAVAMSAAVNVALNKTVTLSGTTHGAAASTLVDGVFRPRGTGWTSGTVYWNGTSPYVEIDLGGTFQIESFIAQADDNDAYTIKYRDVNTYTWKTAWDVPNYDAYGSGMQTRPNPANDAARYMLSAPITTDMLRFCAASGDNSYSVSEIQAYGTSPVPLPAAIYLLGPGLLGLWRIRRKADN